MAVVLFHLGFSSWIKGNAQATHFEAIAFIVKYGHFGVHFFFIISGYVISMSMQERTALQFAFFRAIRLYPAYWIAIILTSSIITIGQQHDLMVDAPSFLINFTMLQSFFNVANVDGTYWTLSFELRFYLLIFLILLARASRFYAIFLMLWLLLSAAAFKQLFVSSFFSIFFFRHIRDILLWVPAFIYCIKRKSTPGSGM